MNANKVKVLYITGSPRSGSTIISKILGQVSGFFHAGELRFIWDKNFLEGFPCGCGEPFFDCDIWSGVIRTAFGEFSQEDALKMLEYREKYTRTKHLPIMLSSQGRYWLKIKINEFISNLDKLYPAIQQITQCQVIIDSSKFSSYGFILSMVPSVDVFYLHLVRDSRAVANSRLKIKIWEETGTYMARYNPLRSSLQWSALNITSELLKNQSKKHYLLTRYEDFVKHPIKSVDRILNYLQQVDSQLPFKDDHVADLYSTHSNWGNPIRTKNGMIELILDEEWRTNLRMLNKTLVTTITLPLLIRYDYLNKTGGTS